MLLGEGISAPMRRILPFAGLEWRTACVRGVLLTSMALGMIASGPVWRNARTLPPLPITSWIPVLPGPWDQALFAGMLLALVVAGWWYRPAIICFLAGSFVAFCEDQNRGQPWFYMYWVMLLLTLGRPPAAMAACRCALSVAYIWSGIQKCNPRFFQVVPEWFVAPAGHWHLPQVVTDLMRYAIATAPFLEIGIGMGLWVPRLRLAAIGAALLVHLAALLFLGPLGYNYNWVVWPWNLAMLGLVWGLFGGTATAHGRAENLPSLRQSVKQLRGAKPACLLVGLYSFLPLLSFWGLWDSDFSFSLYSENQAVANVFVTKAYGDRLPEHLRPYVKPFSQEYDPEHQGPFIFGFQAWYYEKLHVPPIPEPRNFRSVFRYLQNYSQEAGDLRMIIGPRSGPVIFYEGDRVELLQRK